MAKTVRLINASTYQTRGADTAANLSRDRRAINYIRRVVPDEATGSAKIMFEKRPGWTGSGAAVTGTSASYPYGLSLIRNARWGGYGYIFTGGTNMFSIGDCDFFYGTTALGTIAQPFGTGFVAAFQTDAKLSTTNYHLANINWITSLSNPQVVGSKGYFYSITSATVAGALTQITDADYPGGPGPLIQKWGYVFQHSGLGVYNSDINSISSWTAGSYFPTNAIIDNACGVWNNGNDLLAAFGSKHIELLYNAGTAVLSPLLRANGGVIELGTPYPTCVTDLGGSLGFIGVHPKSQQLGVYVLHGTSIEKISTQAIDAILHTFGGINVKSFRWPLVSSIAIAGEQHLFISMSSDRGTTNKYLCCRLSDKTWWEYEPSVTNPIVPHASFGDDAGGVVCISGVNNTRYLYTLDQTSPAYTDDGQAYTATLQSARTDFGTSKLKSIPEIDLIGDTSSSGDAHQMYLSFDDGQNFTNIGAIDMSTRNRTLFANGVCQDLMLKIQHSTATPSRIEAVDVAVSVWGA